MNQNSYALTKPRGRSAWTPSSVVQVVNANIRTQLPTNEWVISRPIPYQSLRERIMQAWDVLTYKADALYWGK